MAKSKAFYQKDYGSHVGATILFVTSFLALVFLTCGVPLGVLMLRSNTRSCYTMWGFRPNCWAAAYEWRVEEDTCFDRRTRWEAAEAFSVIALFSLLFNMGTAWMMLSGSDIKTITTLTAIFSVGTTTVPWAVVTSIYYTHYCGEWTFTHRSCKLGTGYILMVLSFALQCVGFILFLFLEPESPTSAASKAEKKRLKDKAKGSSNSSAAQSEEGTSEDGSRSHRSESI